MNKFEVVTKSGKKIYVFDDVYDYAQRTKIYKYVINSRYQVGGIDNGIIENRGHVTMASAYNRDDYNNIGFDQFPKDIIDTLALNMQYVMTNTMVNLCKPDDIFHIHNDSHEEGDYTLIYYANLNWNVEWGGDTVFLNENQDDIEYVSQYTPGRFVIFDGRIPHLIRPSTRLAPEYRFTIASRYSDAFKKLI